MAKRRLTVIAVFGFFMGLPLAGVVYSYLVAQSAIRESAVAFATAEVGEVLRARDYETLRFYGTLTLKNTLARKEFDAWMEHYGAFEALGEFVVGRTTVRDRADQAWQFVELEAPARFANGAAWLKLTVARRSTALGEWRIEEFSLEPADVE